MRQGFHTPGYAAGMAEPRKRNVRWGLLTLLFLAIALASILTSNAQERYTALTLAGLVVGFGGAAFCSWKGLKGFSWLPR
jgi:nitrate/nitrite transporter NarK